MEDTHEKVFGLLGEMKREMEGVNKRLDIANHATAKNIDKLAAQDVLNAQITITQSQLVTELKEMKAGEKINNEFILRTQGSIITFKWIFGFVGFGTLIIFFKVVLGIDITDFIK